MQKKKILLIASTPLSNDGLTKIEMNVIEYNKGIIDFDVACSFGFDNVYGEKLKKQGIICHCLPHKKNIVAYMVAIRKLIKSKAYSAVYIHGNSAMMFMEAIPAKMGGSKVITHCHNTKSDFPLIHYIMKPFFNLAVDEKIGCSILATKWAYCGKNIITIPNGIELEKFAYQNQIREKIREEFKWEDNKVIGHIGRFNKQKNHMRLISIFDTVNHIDCSTRLLLIGDGELKEDVTSEIRRRNLESVVYLLDYTERPQDYIQAMDIMVLPSLFEGLCLVAIEAQANGLPVLIDTLFSPETTASSQVRKLDLSQSDEEWAETILQMLKEGRCDVKEQIAEKELDYQSMMTKIQTILLK